MAPILYKVFLSIIAPLSLQSRSLRSLKSRNYSLLGRWVTFSDPFECLLRRIWRKTRTSLGIADCNAEQFIQNEYSYFSFGGIDTEMKEGGMRWRNSRQPRYYLNTHHCDGSIVATDSNDLWSMNWGLILSSDWICFIASISYVLKGSTRSTAVPRRPNLPVRPTRW